MSKRDTVLIWTQVFLPDVAAVGQQMADLARELARRGHRVIVLTSDRGYENPRVRYPRRGLVGEALVLRLPLCSFGKGSFAARGLGAISFMLQCLALSLFLPRVRGVVFSTSPPLVGALATLAARVRRVPAVYWAMDINPDQLVALGHGSPSSRSIRWLETVHRFVLARSALVVALDRFMAERLASKSRGRLPLTVIPPWPHEDQIHPVPHSENPFRAAHGLKDKLVVMYSGNHSPSNPLDTLLAAAVRFRDHARLRFVFVGGGEGKRAVDECVRRNGLSNVLSLPYQPLSELRYSLSAADVHVVSLGDAMVGIIHPCKVYGAMAVGRPILYLGPAPSHVSELIEPRQLGWQVRHGDEAGMCHALDSILELPCDRLEAIGREARRTLLHEMNQQRLCGALCDAVEGAIGARSVRDVRSRAGAGLLLSKAEREAPS